MLLPALSACTVKHKAKSSIAYAVLFLNGKTISAYAAKRRQSTLLSLAVKAN